MMDDELFALMRRQAQAAQTLREAPGGLEKWVGKVVKVGFEQHTDPLLHKVWMWVEITEVRGRNLVGVLLNRPRYATQLKHGDTVILDKADIFALDTPDREDDNHA